jgi:hypothetical protein
MYDNSMAYIPKNINVFFYGKSGISLQSSTKRFLQVAKIMLHVAWLHGCTDWEFTGIYSLRCHGIIVAFLRRMV